MNKVFSLVDDAPGTSPDGAVPGASMQYRRHPLAITHGAQAGKCSIRANQPSCYYLSSAFRAVAKVRFGFLFPVLPYSAATEMHSASLIVATMFNLRRALDAPT